MNSSFKIRFRTLKHLSACGQPAWRRSIHIFRDVDSLREQRKKLWLESSTVGLVPTMGALHTGHLSLVRQAAQENSHVFVSIYVNPTQFGVNEDLDSYPKTWESDLKMLEELDAELKNTGHGRIEAVFAPTTKIMYPTLPPDSTIPGQGSFITITPLATLLEGKSRPVFFRGVTTVCMKLFSIVQPERVYFGQKDAQQTVIIKRMVKDFHLNTQVRVMPTEREQDGLAMSSRNVYLGERRRNVGIVLRHTLTTAEQAYINGARTRNEILGPAEDLAKAAMHHQQQLDQLKAAPFEIDYISLADPDSLEEIDEVDDRGALLSGAIKMKPLESVSPSEKLGLGGDKVPVRLIDNIVLEPKLQ